MIEHGSYYGAPATRVQWMGVNDDEMAEVAGTWHDEIRRVERPRFRGGHQPAVRAQTGWETLTGDRDWWLIARAPGDVVLLGVPHGGEPAGWGAGPEPVVDGWSALAAYVELRRVGGQGTDPTGRAVFALIDAAVELLSHGVVAPTPPPVAT